MKSQNEQIKQHLKSGKWITPYHALELYGCFRLAARISDLREQGMNIKTEIVNNGKKRYAKYFL